MKALTMFCALWMVWIITCGLASQAQDPPGAGVCCFVSNGTQVCTQGVTEQQCYDLFDGVWLAGVESCFHQDADCDALPKDSHDCEADGTADGIVDVEDLLLVIDQWGVCPSE